MINFLFGLFQSSNALRYTFWLLWRLKVDIWLSLSSLQFTDTYQVLYFTCRLLKIKVSFLEEKGKKKHILVCYSERGCLFSKIYCAILWQKWIVISFSKRHRGLLHPMWPSDVSVITTVLRQFIIAEFQDTKWRKEAWIFSWDMMQRPIVQWTKWTKNGHKKEFSA